MFHAQRFTAFAFPCLVALLCCESIRAGDGTLMQPYTVFVSQAASFARSGPESTSSKPYRTDPLRLGQQLEVYAETTGGWLGIRPPEGSFSWIPADAVEADSTGTQGTVTEDASIVWVGTQLGQARNYGWQVRLYEGEPVAILGQSERDGPDGPQLWYRIVPPSGEFRFIHKSETVTSSEALVASIQPSDQTQSGKDIQFSPSGPRSLPEPRQSRVAGSAPTISPSVPASSRRRIEAGAAAVADSQVVAASGSSVLENADMVTASQNETWQSAAEPLPPSLLPPREEQASAAPDASPRPRGLLASVAFLGRPKIRQIGEAEPTQAPSDNKGWVAGIQRRLSPAAPADASPMTQPFEQKITEEAEVAQVSGIAPLPAQELIPAPAPASGSSLSAITTPPRLSPIGGQSTFQSKPTSPTARVSPARLADLQRQIQGADLSTMQVLFSQLMASQSSSAEARVVADAAQTLSQQTSDPNAARQAQTLANRAADYSHLAMRRDGEPTVQQMTAPVYPSAQSTSATTPAISSSPTPGPTPVPTPGQPPVAPPGPKFESISGQLVQVYSARPQSPPFALTDGTGRTIAYVTPSPGINLRMHLNSEVTVTGEKGFVSGVNLPHVFAEKAERVASGGLQFR